MFFFMKKEYWEYHPFFFIMSTPSFFLITVILYISILFSSQIWSQVILKKMQVKSHGKEAQKKAMMIVGFALFFVFFEPLIDSIPSVNHLFIFVTCIICFSVGTTYYQSLLLFHLINDSQKKRKFLAQFKIVAACVLFCMFCGTLTRFEMNSPSYSAASKTKTILLYSDFVPTLTPETVREMLELTTLFSDEIFRNADPEIYQLPVENFLRVKDLGAYKSYLKYGRPSEQNLIYLMTELETHPDAKTWRNPHAYAEVKFRLVHHWPEASALPEKLLDAKITTKPKRDMASVPDEKEKAPESPNP